MFTLNTRSHDVIAVSARNKLVDRGNVLQPAEPIVLVNAIGKIVSIYNAMAIPIANHAIGAINNDITLTAHLAKESALGDVIADAQPEATAPAAKDGAANAFMNTGGIRSDLLSSRLIC